MSKACKIPHEPICVLPDNENQYQGVVTCCSTTSSRNHGCYETTNTTKKWKHRCMIYISFSVGVMLVCFISLEYVRYRTSSQTSTASSIGTLIQEVPSYVKETMKGEQIKDDLIDASFGVGMGLAGAGEESQIMQYNYDHETIIHVNDFHEILQKEEEKEELNEHQQEQQQMTSPKSKKADVAWIMSFGGSGTSYTITNMEKMTNQTTASNYGEEYIPCISYDERQQGPYIRSLKKDIPDNYILTKTHCGGYCMDCPPSMYVYNNSVKAFEESCRSGKKRRPSGTIVSTTYASDIPKRVIHLIRNPFDNLVGRMHLAMKHRVTRTSSSTTTTTTSSSSSSSTTKSRHDLSTGNVASSTSFSTATTTTGTLQGYEHPEDDVIYSNDVNGMKDWCHYLDTQFNDIEHSTFSHDFMETYYNTNIPCHAEWFRYIQWHNLAYQVHTESLQLPVHYLYYDNYTSHFNETVEEIFDFLEFPLSMLQNTPSPWIAGKSYYSFFDVHHAVAATTMVQKLALPPVWDLIQHYFDAYFMDRNTTYEEARQLQL